MADSIELMEAKRRLGELLNHPRVSGIGTGGSIRVYVEKLTDDLISLVPNKIDGFDVDLVESGRFKIFQQQSVMLSDATSKMRPAMGGISIGHFRITAGTLGSRVYDAATKKRMILSNNHVLANMAGINNTTRVGDAILQPGAYDGGTVPADMIATLTRWINYNVGGTNVVDCALATPLNDGDLSDEILGIGVPATSINSSISVGDQITKSGRTTGVTTGTVLDTAASIKVYFTEAEYLQFDEQIIAENMGSPGDSGSLMMDMSHRPAGLLFAGSDNFTCFNKILPICQKLGIDFGDPVPQPPVQAGSWIMFAAALGIPVGYFIFGRKGKKSGRSSVPFKL